MKSCVFNKKAEKINSFSLIELLVAMAVLTILVVLFAQMLTMVVNTWALGRSQADNFSQARTALDLMGRDIEASVIRPDLPAFFNSSSPGLIFYTKQSGLKTLRTTGTRPLSMISYNVTNLNGTNCLLRRSSCGFNYGDDLEYSRTTWGMQLPTAQPVFDADVGPGVLAMKYQFMGTNGTYIIPERVNPAWTNKGIAQGMKNLRAVTISLVVIDGEALKLLQISGKLNQLQANFNTNDPGLIRSFRSNWQVQLEDGNRPLANGGIPLKVLQGLRTFERTVMLPPARDE